jgi:hypothetical protein
MNNGGREALLHYLLNFDLTKVNLRTIPDTAALTEQKIESLSVNQQWWLDVLKRGELPGCNGNCCTVGQLHEAMCGARTTSDAIANQRRPSWAGFFTICCRSFA